MSFYSAHVCVVSAACFKPAPVSFLKYLSDWCHHTNSKCNNMSVTVLFSSRPLDPRLKAPAPGQAHALQEALVAPSA